VNRSRYTQTCITVRGLHGPKFLGLAWPARIVAQPARPVN